MSAHPARSGRRSVLQLGGAACLAWALPARAHHGWAGYGDEDFSLDGTIEEIDLGYPHGRLGVRAADGLWNVVLGPPSRNRRAGIDEGVLVIGDEVTAYGHRHSDPATLEIKTERLVAGAREFVIYPARS